MPSDVDTLTALRAIAEAATRPDLFEPTSAEVDAALDFLAVCHNRCDDSCSHECSGCRRRATSALRAANTLRVVATAAEDNLWISECDYCLGPDKFTLEYDHENERETAMVTLAQRAHSETCAGNPAYAKIERIRRILNGE